MPGPVAAGGAHRGGRIFFCGSATWDTIYRVERMPAGPGKVLPTALVEIAHGMAASAAATAARLGGSASLISRIGSDAVGARIIADLEQAGVDCRHVRTFEGVGSPLSTVIVDAEGERLVVPFYPPGLGRETGWLPLEEIRTASAVLVDIRWPEGAAAVLDAAREADIPRVLDADVGEPSVIAALTERASHAVFSEPAALAVSGASNVPEAVRSLASRFSCFVAVTAGGEGCFWMDEAGEICQERPPRIKAVDTLAAGDVFHGAFVLGLTEGMPVRQLIRFANAAAALKCTVFGGRAGTPSRDQVEAALAAV